MRVHLTANAFRQQNDMVRIVFYQNYSGEGIGDFGGAKNGGKKDEERPKEETIREARGCRERCAWKAKEGGRGKSIPYL